MFHGLTKICAHVKYSCGSILTQIHPVMIFLTPRQSIPKCPEGFPNSFLTYWKTDREVLYGKSMHFKVLTTIMNLFIQIPKIFVHTVLSGGAWEWFSAKALLLIHVQFKLFRYEENLDSPLLSLTNRLTSNRQGIFPIFQKKNPCLCFIKVEQILRILQ